MPQVNFSQQEAGSKPTMFKGEAKSFTRHLLAANLVGALAIAQTSQAMAKEDTFGYPVSPTQAGCVADKLETTLSRLSPGVKIKKNISYKPEEPDRTKMDVYAEKKEARDFEASIRIQGKPSRGLGISPLEIYITEQIPGAERRNEAGSYDNSLGGYDRSVLKRRLETPFDEWSLEDKSVRIRGETKAAMDDCKIDFEISLWNRIKHELICVLGCGRR
jgi:hypothetical protein